MFLALIFILLISGWIIRQTSKGTTSHPHRHRTGDTNTHEPNQTVWPKLYAVFPGGWNGGGGIVHSYNLGFHRQAVDWYAAGFYKALGRFPDGDHSFEVTYSRDGSAPVRTPIGNGHGTRRLTMKFVTVSEDARADYERKELCYEIKT